MPIVKHSFMIQHPLEVPRVVHEAFHIARTGRPGPVLIDMPTDLTRVEIDYQPVGDVRLPGYQPTTEGNQKQIRLAAKAIANARRPVVYAGGGVINSGASTELTELAVDGLPDHLHADGPRRLPGPHKQWLGMLGMHGTRTANYAMDEADLIVAVGARFDDRITGKLSEFAPRAKFVHIDIDPAEISKNVPAHIPIVGDARNILARLLTEYRGLSPTRRGCRSGGSGSEQWRAQYPLRYEDSTDNEIKPQYLVQALYEATDNGDCILATDIGQHQMWAAQYFHFTKPRRWIQSGGLGTMGFGLPAAMGAAVAQPELRTIVLSGDASIQMNMQELSTLATYGIPVKVVIMNNGFLGMVRQWQELFWDGRYSAVEMSQWPDYVKLAEAMGCHGVRLEDKTTLVADLRAALALDGRS